jgi:hypothetical protein|tara:strand:- start:2746 stop:3789 length:1044 start_codon:yes stop_codon:yes gene_type:complete
MVLFSQKSLAFTLASFGIIVVASYFSGFIQTKLSNNNDEVIRKYLLNESPLYGHNRPKLWIHTTYEYNARKWQSFGSRSSTDLNQPYLHLTIRSIINHCGNSFHVCLIDDDSFNQLIPDWNITVKNLPDPHKSHYRNLAMAHLLYVYGGIVVPNSFICMKDLSPFYQQCVSENKPFACEMPNNSPNFISSNKIQKFTSSPCFMGAPKQHPIIKEYVLYLKQQTQSQHFRSDTEFFGYYSKWLNIQVHHNKMNLLDGLQIGVKEKNGRPILLEDLMEEKTLNLCTHQTFGVYIPRDEVLKRVKYQWFAVMSAQELLQTNMIVTKYMLHALANDQKVKKVSKKTSLIAL